MQKKITIYIFLLTLCASCSVTRKVPDGQHLYIKSKFKIKKSEKQINISELKTVYETILKNPKPNKKFLGRRWELRFYNFFYTKKEKGLWLWLQTKLGEPPVLYDQQITDQTEQLMQNRAFNEGYFKTEISSAVKKKRRKAKVKYSIKVERQYMVGNFKNGVSDSLVYSIIENNKTASPLKTGQHYDLGKLKQERERITALLRQTGFYFFRNDYLKFKADTTRTSYQVQLELVLKEEVNPSHLKPQTIRQITVFPELNFKTKKQLPNDTISYDGLKIIAARGLVKPATLREAITLKTGHRYSTTDHQATLERLSFLRNYQFIDVRFGPSPRADSLLDVMVRLTPRQLKTIDGSLGASVKGGLYAGPEISLSYLNRNVFRGAEQLKLTYSGIYNYPLSSDVASRIEQGATLELSKPGLIIPFVKDRWTKGLIAQSKFSFSFSGDRIRIPLNGAQGLLMDLELFKLSERLLADTTFAPYVALDNYDFSLSYQWRRKKEVQHELTPINLVLQAPRYEEDGLRELFLFISRLADTTSMDTVQLNLEQMLIIKPSYVYLYDSRLKKLKNHNFFYRGKVAISGNRLLKKNSLIPRDNLESQFFQLENEWRYYLRFSERQTLAGRFSTKFSFPFRNEVLLPFFDLYAVGGPNSIRAFQPRRVGPGSVEPANETFFFTGTGDILLESSIEYRLKLTKLFELGFFADAGNVWLFKGGNTNNDLATFKINSFHQQLAFGTGFGFRFDFEVLLIRLDFGFPLTQPWLPDGQRWVGDQLSLWNGVSHFAFGYSF